MPNISVPQEKKGTDLVFCRPDGPGLLDTDDVLQALVPRVGAASKAEGGGEEMATILAHFGGLGIKAPGALLRVWR